MICKPSPPLAPDTSIPTYIRAWSPQSLRNLLKNLLESFQNLLKYGDQGAAFSCDVSKTPQIGKSLLLPTDSTSTDTIQWSVLNSFLLPSEAFIEGFSLYKTLSMNCLFGGHANYIPATCNTFNLACQVKYPLAHQRVHIRDQLWHFAHGGLTPAFLKPRCLVVDSWFEALHTNQTTRRPYHPLQHPQKSIPAIGRTLILCEWMASPGRDRGMMWCIAAGHIHTH